MKVTTTSRGFEVLEHRPHDPSVLVAFHRLAQASSALGDDNLGRPGTSFLWLEKTGTFRIL